MRAPPRLATPEQFRLVYREGARVGDDLITLRVRCAGGGPSRIGIAVRRQIGTAVRRNRIRRRLREAAARAYGELPAGLDVVIAPRTAAVDASFQELVTSLTELFTRARSGVRP